MSVHLTSEQIEKLMKRQLAAEQLLSAMQHLENCEACRAAIATQSAAAAQIDSLRSTLKNEAQNAHLSYEQLEDFVTGKVGGNEQFAINAHLDLCAECTQEIQSLQELQNSFATMPLQAITTSENKNSIWQIAESFFSRRIVAATLSATVLLVLGFWSWQSFSQQKEISQAQALPAKSPENNLNQISAPTPSTATAPVVVAKLIDGGQQITLDQQGKISGFASITPDDAAMVKAALAHQKLPVASTLRELTLQRGTLMGSGKDAPVIKAIFPVAKILPTDRVTFRWQPITDATSYRVTILDTDFNILQTSELLSAPQWTTAQALPRGKTYLWQVTAIVNGKELNSTSAAMPEARFQILSQQQTARLNNKKQQYAHSHLLLGLAFAQEGLLDEAAREFRLLQKANPQSPIPKKLLRNLLAAGS